MHLSEGHKYGRKTTAQIAALTGMSEGDTVFNTDYHVVEWYTGDVWTNDSCVLMVASETIAQGECVSIDTSGEAELITTTNDARGIGVCHYGGVVNDTISIIVQGKAAVLAGATVVLGQYLVPDSTAGRMTDTTSASSGAAGRWLDNGINGDLVWALLSFIERA